MSAKRLSGIEAGEPATPGVGAILGSVTMRRARPKVVRMSCTVWHPEDESQ
jgi:hypothetical protein